MSNHSENIGGVFPIIKRKPTPSPLGIIDNFKIRPYLDEAYTQVIEIINNHGGIFEEYNGEESIASFGLYDKSKAEPQNAIASAIASKKFTMNFNKQLLSEIECTFHLRCGINTGSIYKGLVKIEDGTRGLTGDSLEIASHLNYIADDDEILLGHETHEKVRAFFRFEEIGPVQVRNIINSVRVFRCI